MTAVHRATHGLIPNEIIGVSEDNVLRLLGRMSETGSQTPGVNPFRTILFTESSPDGRTLNLWTVPVNGGESDLLLRDAAYGSYSPDGTRLAFLRLYLNAPGYGPRPAQ